jgi:hypothetical protein
MPQIVLTLSYYVSACGRWFFLPDDPLGREAAGLPTWVARQPNYRDLLAQARGVAERRDEGKAPGKWHDGRFVITLEPLTIEFTRQEIAVAVDVRLLVGRQVTELGGDGLAPELRAALVRQYERRVIDGLWCSPVRVQEVGPYGIDDWRGAEAATGAEGSLIGGADRPLLLDGTPGDPD